MTAMLALRQSAHAAERAVYGVGSGGGSDERKPRCQNCIDKSFDCNYGLQVTFLPKNSITLTSGEIQSPRGDRSANYNKIQFVNEDPLSIDNLAGLPAETQQLSSPASTVSSTPLPPPPSRGGILRGKEIEKHPISIYTPERESERQNENHSNSRPDDREPYSHATPATWELDNHNHNTQNPNPPSLLEPQFPFSKTDESAVQGLLALGAQSAPNPGDAIPVSAISNPIDNAGMGLEDAGVGIGPGTPRSVGMPNRTIGGSGSDISPSFIDGILGISTPAVHFDVGTNSGISHSYSNSNQNHGSDTSSETYKMKLMRHYRYIVAPWLDIHDLNHSFGITALQTAVNSPSGQLLPALIALSEACLQVEGDRGWSYAQIHGIQAAQFDGELAAPYSQFSEDLEASVDMHESFTEAVLLRVFQELRSLVLDIAGAWAKRKDGEEHGSEYEDRLLRWLAHTAYGIGIESAVYWIFLRMDLGISLVNNTPLRTPLPSLQTPSLAPLSCTESTPERVAHYAQVLLGLCGKALTTYHQESTTHQIPGTDSWLQIFEELNQWHILRPQEFQPMVELDNDTSIASGDDEANILDLELNAGSEFPLLLFTNGAAALCNQLYHTTMLFVLERKPRTAALLNQRYSHPHSPVLSPLWHAQRVCGIALNNDRRECWDPCLLASFLVASRHMTHESQQAEIVRGFDRIQTLTGWGVGEYLAQLREEWSYLDGVE
ncbi:hypothetical protein BJX76DRAFT_369410 [Aspergillus varians]